jgi:hypothetical protein
MGNETTTETKPCDRFVLKHGQCADELGRTGLRICSTHTVTPLRPELSGMVLRASSRR